MTVSIGKLLSWKFNDAPGIATYDGAITEWPAALGAMPTADTLAQWAVDYESAEAGKTKTVTVTDVAQVLADLAATVAELRAEVEKLKRRG